MGKNLRIAYFHYGIFEGGDNNGWKRTYNLAKGLSEMDMRSFYSLLWTVKIEKIYLKTLTHPVLR